MSKLTENTIARIIACFLFTVSAAVFVLSGAAIVLLSEFDVYFDDGAALRHGIYSTFAHEAEREIMSSYVVPALTTGQADESEYNYLKDRYSSANSNISVRAETSNGSALFKNDVSEGSRFNYSNTWTVNINPAQGTGENPKFYASGSFMNSNGNIGYYIFPEKSGENNSNITVNFYASVRDKLSARDKLFYLIALADLFIKNRYLLVAVCIVSFLIAVFLFVFMLYSAGHRKGHEGIYLEPQDKIPLDLFGFVSVAFCGFCAYIAIAVIDIYGTANVLISIAIFVAAFLVCLLVMLALVLTFVTRIKYGKWWKNTVIFKVLYLIYRIFAFFFRKIARLCKNLPMFWKTALIFIAISLAELVVLLKYSFGTIFVFWMVEKLIVGSVLFFTVIDMKNIKKGAEEIASGNTGYQINTAKMYGDFKKHAETLNKVNDGLSNAVNERMKSERLKTELITNVSHDLKTPLTSIVNYVDLMKKEDIQPEKAKEYLEVLDRQSKRLKKLTLDLLEASKASTGNIKVSNEPTDIKVLLSQLEGEYAEKLAASNLELHVSVPWENMWINADGRLLSRVFDNLMNNIFKYTQPGTRVYVTAKENSGKAVIEFKNISKYQLNISGDELMERFVRGDSSRNTEGSGLGLSIAKSLTELQNGSLEIMVDGDLFKAIVSMELAPPEISFSEEDV